MRYICKHTYIIKQYLLLCCWWMGWLLIINFYLQSFLWFSYNSLHFLFKRFFVFSPFFCSINIGSRFIIGRRKHGNDRKHDGFNLKAIYKASSDMFSHHQNGLTWHLPYVQESIVLMIVHNRLDHHLDYVEWICTPCHQGKLRVDEHQSLLCSILSNHQVENTYHSDATSLT